MGRAIFISGIGKFCACVVGGVHFAVVLLTDRAVSQFLAGCGSVALGGGGVVAPFTVTCTAVFANCQSGAGRRAAGVFALAGSIFLEQTAQRAVFYDLICRGGIQSGVAVDDTALYRATFATVNATCSVRGHLYITQISNIVRTRVMSECMNLRIRDNHNRDRFRPTHKSPSTSDTGSRTPIITSTIGIYDRVCNIDCSAGAYSCRTNG